MLGDIEKGRCQMSDSVGVLERPEAAEAKYREDERFGRVLRRNAESVTRVNTSPLIVETLKKIVQTLSEAVSPTKTS